MRGIRRRTGKVLAGTLVWAASAASVQAQVTERLGAHFDIFAGRNNTGPYTLSWKGIRADRDAPVEVVIDGRTLKKDEFTVDTARGTITFTRLVADSSVVRVRYSYVPGASQRNPNPASNPLTLPIARIGDSTLALVAIPNGGEPGRTGPDPLVWSLGATSRFLGGGVRSNFHYAGENGAGWRLGFQRGSERNGIDVGFSRADRQFASSAGKSLGMADASERRSLAARYAPSKYVGTRFSFDDSSNLLTDERKGQTVFGLRLGGWEALPTLDYARTTDRTTGANRAVTDTTTDRFGLTASLDRRTSVNATTTATSVHATNPDATSTGRTTSVSLNASADGGTKKATATVNTSDKTTGTAVEENKGLSVRLQPAPVFVVSAGQSERKVLPVREKGTSGTPSTVLSQNVGAEIVPLPGARFTGSVTETLNDGIKNSTTGFSGQLGAGKRIEITGGIINRSSDANGPGPLDTTRARVALRPLKVLTVTGAYTWNPEENGTVRQALRQELGLSASLGAIELGSAYSMTTLNGIAGEDVFDPQFGTVSLSLGLRFSRYTSLSGSFKDSLRNRSAVELTPSLLPQYLRTYGLGLTHSLGSSFNFALGGSLTEDRSGANQPRDVRGEARLGLRF
ncbi:MAG: hypothetical protein SFU56_12050 [Capsulimonadales bacterium]|nr:hypothetical protein [Capsulimonadales bacterium]